MQGSRINVCDLGGMAMPLHFLKVLPNACGHVGKCSNRDSCSFPQRYHTCDRIWHCKMACSCPDVCTVQSSKQAGGWCARQRRQGLQTWGDVRPVLRS
jgi:hypothetical protein